MSVLLVFLSPPLLVAYVGCILWGWGMSSEQRWKWVASGFLAFGIAFAMIALGVRW